MKRISAAILAICLMFICGTSAIAASSPETEVEVKPLLSEMEEDQCMEILSDLGVTVPAELKSINIKEMVKDIESDVDMEAPVVNYMPAADLFENVRTAVKSYHEPATTVTTQYTLQNSILHSWSTDMKKYNCYAYAIGEQDNFYNPGDFSGQSYDDKADITSVADMIKDDLQGSLEYNCVKVQAVRPSSVGIWRNVIAVRKDTTGDYYGFSDFHFAKLSGSTWYHKPGSTAVLRFISVPSNSVVWSNEAFDGESYHPPFVWYESNIMYLLYKPSHGSTTYTWTGQDYHAGSKHYYQYGYLCSDCGEYTNLVWTSTPCSGPPCASPWSLTPVSEAP